VAVDELAVALLAC